MHKQNDQFVFTQHLVEGSWFITIVQDVDGNLVEILEEPLFETDVEFEADFEIEITPHE